MRGPGAAAQALLDAFFVLVLTRAYEEVTVQTIAARAGVGRSTFYAHFPGKNALLAASLARPLQHPRGHRAGGRQHAGADRRPRALLDEPRPGTRSVHRHDAPPCGRGPHAPHRAAAAPRGHRAVRRHCACHRDSWQFSSRKCCSRRWPRGSRASRACSAPKLARGAAPLGARRDRCDGHRVRTARADDQEGPCPSRKCQQGLIAEHVRRR